MSEKKFIFDCEVVGKVFKKADGEEIPYYDIRLNIDDNQVKLFVDQKDKSLFKYLIKDYEA